MSGDRERQLIVLLALFGLLVWAVRLHPLPVLSLPTREQEPPREELAREMEVYELSVLDGSPLSLHAYEEVHHLCGEQQADHTAVLACTAFDDALKRNSDRQAIEGAIRLLRDG